MKPTPSKNHLKALIQSLSKAEKRAFKLYVNRTQSRGRLKIVQLFDLIDKKSATDALILKKLKNTSKSQLSNLKHHLYQQILTSLRLLHIKSNVDIEIREQIDFARILYGKGLFLQSLRVLERIRTIADAHHQDLLHLEILEFQKRIEERHITRSRGTAGKMESLLKEAVNRSEVILNACRLSNLKIDIHGYYITYGHARNEGDAALVKAYFQGQLIQIDQTVLTFFERVYLYQSYVWYHHILLDFDKEFTYALKWVQAFESHPNMIEEDPDLYLRGYHYLLTALYNEHHIQSYGQHISRMEAFCEKTQEAFNHNSQMISFLYLSAGKLNRSLIDGSFEKGIEYIPEIETNLLRFQSSLDPHRYLVFYFKIAWLFFGLKKFEQCQEYLVKITDIKVPRLREDIQEYARMMELLLHYELGNYLLLESLVKSVQRQFEKKGILH